jgi:hypothetical protein
LGDVDKDGCADFAVGVARSKAGGFDAGAVYIVSGKTGKELAHEYWPSPCQAFGTCLSTFRDFDGDGVEDFAVGAPHRTGWEFESETCQSSGVGSVMICSGKSGKVLARFDGAKSGDSFGWAVAPAGDVDADSIVDLVVGAPGSGDVYVLSGKSGKRVLHLPSDPAVRSRGDCVSGIGDLNCDGHADLAIGSPYENVTGCVILVSGKDGSVIHRLEPLELGILNRGLPSELRYDRTRFGIALAFVPGVAGDDLLVVGADGAHASGRVVVYTLKDRKRIRVLEGTEWAFSKFGSGVDVLGDVDGDGNPELLIANPDDDLGEPMTHGQAPGSVAVFSGTTGERLYSMHGDKHLDRLGYAVASCGDLNSDGVPDFVAEAHVGWGQAPYFRAYSGVDGKLLFQFDTPESKSTAKAADSKR